MQWHAQFAWLGDGVAADVLIEADGERITRLARGVPAPPHAQHLPGLTLPGLANAHSHFVRAVRNGEAADLLAARQRPADLAWEVGELAKIAMPAGHRDHRSRGKNSRAPGQPVVDCVLQTEHRAADIPNGGEAAQQRVPRLVRGKDVVIADVAGDRLCRGRSDQHRMPVRVDQARHQGPPAAVDYAHAGFGGNRARRNS